MPADSVNVVQTFQKGKEKDLEHYRPVVLSKKITTNSQTTCLGKSATITSSLPKFTKK